MKPVPASEPEPDYGNDIEKARAGRLKEQGDVLMGVITSFGNSRELALARTKVEEAVMWAQRHLSK